MLPSSHSLFAVIDGLDSQRVLICQHILEKIRGLEPEDIARDEDVQRDYAVLAELRTRTRMACNSWDESKEALTTFPVSAWLL